MGVISFRVIMIHAKSCLVVLFIVGYTQAQATATCGGAGATCKDATFADLCTCPAGTACAPGAGGSFCQYTFCLPDSMMCSGNIGHMYCCNYYYDYYYHYYYHHHHNDYYNSSYYH